MYNFYITSACYVVVSFGILSCTQEPASENISIVKVVCLPEKGERFRGLQLGSNYSDVVSHEKLRLVSDADSILEYEKSFLWAEDSIRMVVYYAFDSYGLFEIQVDLFAQSKSSVDNAFQEFETHYDSLFGEPYCAGLMCRWTTVSPTNNVVEITLSNESVETTKPFLSINYLEPLSNEI